MLKTLALACLPCLAFTATTGSPDPVFPGPSPGLWMDLGNDNFLPEQPDDRKTASWAFGARDGDWLLGGEYDMLTSKTKGTRQDVLTGMIGGVLVEESGYRFSTSVGIRNYHGIGGQDLQNFDHSHTNDPSLHLRYDDNIMTGVWMCDIRQTKVIPVGDQVLGYFWVAQDCITSRANEVEVWGGPCADITQHGELPSFVWIGCGYRYHGGGYYGTTDEDTQKAYQGFSIRSGLRLQALSVSLTVGSHASYATLGVCW